MDLSDGIPAYLYHRSRASQKIVQGSLRKLVRDVSPVTFVFAEEDPAAIELFQAFVTIAKGNLAALIDAGAVDPEVDVDWAAMHTTIFVLGSILFQRAVSQQLGKSLLDRDELERWHRASTDLFQRGLAPPTDRTAP